jgi:hypothetical protein
MMIREREIKSNTYTFCLEFYLEYAENENWVYDVGTWLQQVFEATPVASFKIVRKKILELSHVRLFFLE